MNQNKMDNPIIIGDLNEVELKELSKEFPVWGTVIKEPAALIKYLSKRTGKTPGELLDLWRKEPNKFRFIAREVYNKDVATARLINLANKGFQISEGLKYRLRNPNDLVQKLGYIPYGVKNLPPLKELDPANTDTIGKEDEDLERALKKLLDL